MGIKKMALEPLERPAMIPFTTPGWGKNESKVRKGHLPGRVDDCRCFNLESLRVCENTKVRRFVAEDLG